MDEDLLFVTATTRDSRWTTEECRAHTSRLPAGLRRYRESSEGEGRQGRLRVFLLVRSSQAERRWWLVERRRGDVQGEQYVLADLLYTNALKLTCRSRPPQELL